jgi:hypothetical protein
MEPDSWKNGIAASAALPAVSETECRMMRVVKNVATVSYRAKAINGT